MATIDSLQLAYRLILRAYPFRKGDWKPGTILQKPLASARIALVTSAGFYGAEQGAFDEGVLGGDWSYREILNSVSLQRLKIGHKSPSFDHAGIEADRNLALPVDRLQELVSAGVIGEAAPRHYSFLGSAVAPGRLVARTAPEMVGKLVEDSVDAVFLTPV